MEKFILVDAVLQAEHMNTFEKKAKHLKRYDLKKHGKKISNISRRQLHSLNRQKINKISSRYDFDRRMKNLSTKQNNITSVINRQNNSLRNSHNNQHEEKIQRNPIKPNKLILQQHQKIDSKNFRFLKQKEDQPMNDFFVERKIEPRQKTSREFVRPQTLVKKFQNLGTRFFYDLNLNLIKQRPKQCLIMPESQSKSTREKVIHSQINQSKNIQDYVKLELQQQKRNRKANCKTANSCIRHKAVISKQTKKIEQQLRTRELDQHSGCNKYVPSQNQHYRHHSGLQIDKKSIQPLDRQQLKFESTCIMRKYGIDMNKYFYKLHGQ